MRYHFDTWRFTLCRRVQWLCLDYQRHRSVSITVTIFLIDIAVRLLFWWWFSTNPKKNTHWVLLGENRETRVCSSHVAISGYVYNQKVQCPDHTPARNKRNASNSSSITELLILLHIFQWRHKNKGFTVTFLLNFVLYATQFIRTDTLYIYFHILLPAHFALLVCICGRQLNNQEKEAANHSLFRCNRLSAARTT